MKKLRFLSLLLLAGCIGEDVVPGDPQLEILNSVSDLKVLQSHQFGYSFSIAFEIEPDNIIWSSDNEAVLQVDEMGTAIASTTAGAATLTATAMYRDDIMATNTVAVEVTEYSPTLRITNPITSLAQADTYQLTYLFIDELSMQATPSSLTWESSDESILTVNSSGLLSGNAEGTAIITATINHNSNTVVEQITVMVSSTTEMMDGTRFGELTSSSAAMLAGSFEIDVNEADELVISFGENYAIDNSLTGLYVYLSNSPSQLTGAVEVGEVTVFSGAHQYEVPGVGLLDYAYLVYAIKSNQNILGSGEVVDDEVVTMKFGELQTSSSYLLLGDFTLTQDGADLLLEFADNYDADTGLPGLFVYLSNSTTTNANAIEIQAVQVFSGAHSYTIPNININDYQYVLYFCKPFNQRVGHGLITDDMP